MININNGKSAIEIMFEKKTNKETENKGVSVNVVYEAKEEEAPIILESWVEEYMKK